MSEKRHRIAESKSPVSVLIPQTPAIEFVPLAWFAIIPLKTGLMLLTFVKRVSKGVFRKLCALFSVSFENTSFNNKQDVEEAREALEFSRLLIFKVVKGC